MFCVNDVVLYGNEGVCRIDDITQRSFGDKSGDYYVLRPVNNGQLTLYVSVANGNLESKVRKMVTADEITEIIDSTAHSAPHWINDENERKLRFKEIISSGDRRAILQVIRSIYVHRDEQLQKRKKLHAVDEYMLKDAEKILYDEFAYVLNLKPEQVGELLTSKLAAG
ncbi:MAG: CarD family transcriptional regulator [Oscillospiraceae bacterium]|nr:CarD family transcriptional regulator [Oscillospiraceae bacterium]